MRRNPVLVRALLTILIAAACLALLNAAALFADPFVRSWANRREISKMLTAPAFKDIPADAYVIYYFGESTMVGEPYSPGWSVPAAVNAYLEKNSSGKKYRYFNLARKGGDMDFTAEAVKAVLRDKARLRPSLFVVYAGHNEFFRYESLETANRIWPPSLRFLARLKFVEWISAWLADRISLYALTVDERAFFDRPVEGALDRNRVIEGYCRGLKEIADLTDKNGVGLIVFTAAANYSDYEPNRSVYRGPETRRAAFLEEMHQADEYEKRGDLPRAADSYRAALSIDGGFAETYYRLGKVFEKLENYNEARLCFVKAADEDAMPIRASSAQNKFISELNGYRSCRVIDFVGELGKAAPTGLIGRNFMADGHHPNKEGYRIMAQQLASVISGAPAAISFELSDGARYQAAVSRGQWFAYMATWRFNPSERLAWAGEYFSQAIELAPQNYEGCFGFALIELIRKNPPKAEYWLGEAMKRNPSKTKENMKNPWVVALAKRAVSD